MKKRAFTLIELLLVLSIMAIILSVGIMKFGAISKIEERNEYRSFVKDLKYARNVAMVTRSSVYIVFDSDNRGYRIERVGGKTEKSVALKRFSILNNVGTRKLVFGLNGAPDTGMTIELKGEHRSFIVTVSVATGKINMKGVK